MNEERTTSRRRFLGTAAGATGVALAAAVWRPAQAAAAIPDTGRGVESPTAVERTFRAGVFQLNLDRVDAGLLKAQDGGDAYAEVINEETGATTFTKKHIGAPKYDDFTIRFGFGMNKAIYDWISASWKMNFTRKDGSIVTAGINSQAVSEREFFNALITETGIPACDASSKEAGYLTLNFAPEYTRDKKASGAVTSSTKQKLWLASNFKLELGTLDTTRINKIDAFTIKQSIVTNDIGGERDFQREPGKIEFPNLKISLATSSIASWQTWFDDFVIRGNTTDANEKSGRLVFLSADHKTELAEIKLFNVGVYRLDPDPEDPSSADQIQRAHVELYVERMELNIPPSPVIT